MLLVSVLISTPLSFQDLLLSSNDLEDLLETSEDSFKSRALIVSRPAVNTVSTYCRSLLHMLDNHKIYKYAKIYQYKTVFDLSFVLPLFCRGMSVGSFMTVDE